MLDYSVVKGWQKAQMHWEGIHERTRSIGVGP